MKTVARLFCFGDKSILKDACWCISYFCDASDEQDERIQLILDANFVPTLVSLVAGPTRNMIMPALRALGNLCTGSNEQTQSVLACETFLPTLVKLLSTHQDTQIRRETCWILANIAACTQAQVEMLIRAGALETVWTMFQNKTEADVVKNEIRWIVCNAIRTGHKQTCRELADRGALDVICSTLDNSSSGLVIGALESIQKILGCSHSAVKMFEDRGGRQTLNLLCHHHDTTVANVARRVLSGFEL